MSPKECVFWALNVIDRGHMEPVLIALIVAALIAMLIFSRLSPALLFTLAMSACVLVGAVDIKTVLAKATNEGLVTLILLLLVSIGLERLPWLLSLSNRLVSRSLPSTLLSLSGLTMLFSAFVNNTAVVATLAGALRKNSHHPASQILLPISYAAILGGTLTLIGTSTNLIVSSFLEDVTGSGIAFLCLFTRRLARRACRAGSDDDGARRAATRAQRRTARQ